MSKSYWDDRYSDEVYAFGVEPNDFLCEQVGKLRVGRAMDLGAGEGRNAVFLAKHGMDVLAVDQSDAGLAKAARLAEDFGVALRTRQADLNAFEVEPESVDTIVMCFMHVPSKLRKAVNRRAVGWLVPGGTLLMECYGPDQQHRDTGGPNDLDLLPSLDDLRAELKGLDLLVARDQIREIQEGSRHTGESAVVQILASKPA